MTHEAQREVAKIFARNLDRKLRKALLRAASLASSSQLQTGISVEMFLFSLRAVIGRSLQRYFSGCDALVEVPGSRVKVQNKIADSSQAGSAEVLFAAFDDQLVRILWNAIRISRAMKKRSAGLEDFVASLSLEDELVSHLKADKGVSPLDFIPQLPASETGRNGRGG